VWPTNHVENNGVVPQEIDINSWQARGAWTGIASFAGDFSPRGLIATSAPAELVRTEITEEGPLFGIFDNGCAAPYDIPVAVVANPTGCRGEGNALSPVWRDRVVFLRLQAKLLYVWSSTPGA